MSTDQESEYSHGRGPRPRERLGLGDLPDAVTPAEGGQYTGTAPSQTMAEAVVTETGPALRPPATVPLPKRVFRAKP